MRSLIVLLLALCFLSFGSPSIHAQSQADIDTLIGVSYTIGAPCLGLLIYRLCDGDAYDPSYGDYSLLAGASWVSGTMEADGGSGEAGGVSWQIMRSLSHSYDEEDRLFGFLVLGNEIKAEFLIPLPLADADPQDAFLASFAATLCHYDPVSFGANFIFLELEDGPVPLRISCGVGDTYKLPVTNDIYIRPGIDLKFMEKFTVHAEFYKTIFGRAFLGDEAKLRPSEEFRFTAGVGYNFNEDYGLRLSYINGKSTRWEGDNKTGLNSFTYGGLSLSFCGKW